MAAVQLDLAPGHGFLSAGPPPRRARTSSFQATVHVSPRKNSAYADREHLVIHEADASDIRHVPLGPANTLVNVTPSTAQKPPLSPPTTLHSSPKRASTLVNSVGTSSSSKTSPSRSTPASSPSASSADVEDPIARLFTTEALAKLPLAAEAQRKLAAEAAEAEERARTMPVQSAVVPRGRKLGLNMTAGVKSLTKRASGKIRLLAARQQQTDAPPLPVVKGCGLDEREASRSPSDEPCVGAGEPCPTRKSGIEISTTDGAGHAITAHLPAEEPPAAVEGSESSQSRVASGDSRKRSLTKTRHKGMTRSESDTSLNRTASGKTLRHRTSSPTAFFKKCHSESKTDDEGEATRRSLGRKKSATSLLHSSPTALFHLGKHEPPPPPLITPFVIDVCESPLADKGLSPLVAGAEWPPKRASSMKHAEDPCDDTAVVPNLTSSLVALNRLADSGEQEGEGDRSRIRFPASFGFVMRPGEDIPPVPALPDLSTLKPPSTSASMALTTPGPAPPARVASRADQPRHVLSFEDLLKGDGDAVIRKTGRSFAFQSRGSIYRPVGDLSSSVQSISSRSPPRDQLSAVLVSSRVMLELYTVRHASRMSEHSFRYPSPTQTLRDPPLTAHGMEQTIYLADHLRNKGIGAIFCSPFWRCLQTATPIAESLGLPIFVEPGLSEWYGRVKPNSGIHPRPPPASILAQHFSRISASGHKPIRYPSRRGEREVELHQRAADVLEFLIEDVERNRPEARAILLVSHAATLIALGRALLDDENVDVPTPTAGVSKYVRIGERGQIGLWRSDHLGDCSFLPGGAERDWAFSHIEEIEEIGVCPEEEEEEDGRTLYSKL